MDHPSIHSCNVCDTSGYDADDDGPMRRCVGCDDWYCTNCVDANGACDDEECRAIGAETARRAAEVTRAFMGEVG